MKIFKDQYELTYELFNQIGLSIRNGVVFDQDTRMPVYFNGHIIKATINPTEPCYAGEGEIILDPINNLKIDSSLLAYCINKESNLGNFNCLTYSIDRDNNDLRYTAIAIKMNDFSYKYTKYYINKCLKFLHAMFIIYDFDVDLSNFDSEE